MRKLNPKMIRKSPAWHETQLEDVVNNPGWCKVLVSVELRKNKIETVVPMGMGSSIKFIDYSRNPVKNVDLESLADYPYVSIILLDTPYLNNASREERTKLRNLRLKGHF